MAIVYYDENDNETKNTANNVSTKFERTQKFGTVSNLLNAIKGIDSFDTKSNLNRTIISGNDNTPFNIENAREYLDIKLKDIYGTVVYKSEQGVQTKNFIKLENQFLICFDSKKVLFSKTDINRTSFECFDDSGYCFPELLKIDIKKCHLYLSVGENQPSGGCWPFIFCFSKIARENLVDIIKSDIFKILEVDGYYRLYLGEEENFILIRRLEFILYFEGHYQSFETKNMINFLKWISAIQIRHKNE